jgi:hypothetical protein
MSAWYGIALIDGRPEVIYEGQHQYKADAVNAVKVAIASHLGIEIKLAPRRRRVQSPWEPGYSRWQKIQKLRRMTVKRGCTAAEAANALEKLRKLERGEQTGPGGRIDG